MQDTKSGYQISIYHVCNENTDEYTASASLLNIRDKTCVTYKHTGLQGSVAHLNVTGILATKDYKVMKRGNKTCKNSVTVANLNLPGISHLVRKVA